MKRFIAALMLLAAVAGFAGASYAQERGQATANELTRFDPYVNAP